MSTDPYESRALLEQYLLFHYGAAAEILPGNVEAPAGALDYPGRCARLLLDSTGPGQKARRALDLGCAVGRASFELARGVPEVVALDRSRSFVEAAQRLQREGSLGYERVDEGDRRTPLRAVVPADIERVRVSFVEGDACTLSPELGVFDLVLLANLVDRLPDPAACLHSLASLVAPGGTVLITSPYTWLEDFTPRAAWLGGRAGDRRPTHEQIGEALGAAFAPIGRTDLPFLIREHARKFQWSLAEGTLWRRLG